MSELIAGFVGAIALMIVVAFVLSWPVMMLWNGCLVGAVAGVSAITWTQALGIMILFGILFKSHSK